MTDETPGKKVEVVVIGDVYWDTVIVPQPSRGPSENDNMSAPSVLRIERQAGAWLLEGFITLVRRQIDKENEIEIIGYSDSSKSNSMLTVKGCKRSLKEWFEPGQWRCKGTRVKLYPKGIGGEKPEQVYRMEHVYGDIETRNSPCREKGERLDKLIRPIFEKLNDETLKNILNDNQTRHRILVINDDDDIFRHLKTSGKMIRKLAERKPCGLVLATTNPFEGRDKWDIWKVIEDCELYNRTAVVVSLAALRSQGHNIPEYVALETEAYDLWRHVRSSKLLQDLMKCGHVLARSRDEVFHFNKQKNQFDLYCRPFDAGPDSNPGRYGAMSGYEKILIASIVKEMLVEAVKNPESAVRNLESHDLFAKIDVGICSGMRLWARHFETGFSDKKDPRSYLKNKKIHPFDHLFPSEPKPTQPVGFEKDKNKDGEPPVAWVRFPFKWLGQIPGNTEEKWKTWNRVNWMREAGERQGTGKTFDDCLADIVEKGVDKAIEEYSGLKNNSNKNECGPVLCPIARFGKLEAVDKEELDGFADIYKIILKYLEDDSWKTPLSLGVFGPPGTGKSFAVEEILEAARLSSAKAGSGPPLVYNLAQFTKPENLTRAFHHVQDRALSEEVPLIFFDEFDTDLDRQQYGWLKYFLAPMQDGKFKGADTEASYKIGKAVFMFAGGTAETFSAFKVNVIEKAEKSAKGRDFISRLRGYLNVKEINIKEGEIRVSDLLALRRAILLRSILAKKAKEIFYGPGDSARIDKKLINAFLWVDKYEHGIRSMEAIVQMSRPERGQLRVASLPSKDQLRMHVDDAKFLKFTES